MKKVSAFTKKQKEELKKLSQKAPRAGVHYTKIVPDKTKYTRKKKHKDKP
jgi:hypothetical protein